MTNNHPPGDSTHMKQLYNSPALQQMQAQHSLAAHLPQPKQTDSKPTNGNSRNSTSPVGGVLVWSYGGVLFIYSPSLRCFLPSTHFILQSKQLQDAVHHQLSSHCAHSSLSASNSPPLPAAEISAEFDRILLMNRPGFYSIAHLVALDHRHVSITLHELDLVFCYDFQTGAYTHIVHPPHLCSAGGASANAEANLDSRKQLAHPAITQMVKYVKQPTSSSSSSTSAESSAAADSFSLLCTVKTSDNSTTVSSSSSSLSSSYTCSVALLSLQHGLLSAWNIHAQTPSNAVATSPRHSTELNVVAVCAIELSHAVYYALAFDSPQPQAQLRVYHMESGLCLAVKAAHTAKIVQLHPIRLSKLDSGSATDRGKRVDDCQALLSVSEVGEVKVWSIALDCLHCLMTLTPQMIYGTPSSPVAQQSFRVLQGGPSSPSSSGGGSTSAPSSTATTQSLSFNTYTSSSTTSIMSALSSGSASPFVLSPRVPVSDQVASVKFSSFISAVGQLLLSLDNGVLLFFQLQSSSPSTASSSSSLSSLPSTPFCCSCHSTWTFQLLQRVNLQHLNTASGDVDDNHTHLQHDDDEKEERKHENLRYVTSVCHRPKDSVNDCTLWLGENNGRVSEWRWSKTAVKSAWSAAQSPTASKSTWNPFSIPPISLPSSGSHPAPTMRWYAASVVFDPHSISISESSSSTTAHSTCSSPCSSLPSSPCSSARGSLVMNTNARTAAAVVDEELDALLRKQARQLGKHQRFAANHLMFI